MTTQTIETVALIVMLPFAVLLAIAARADDHPLWYGAFGLAAFALIALAIGGWF